MSSYLKAFSTQAEYETYMAGSPLLPNVSLIGEGEGEVAYNPYVAPPVTAGMICYYNGKKLKFCEKDDWNSGLGTAVGVVVVPSDHTSDGTARVMSLKNMDYNNPDVGLTKYAKVPTWDNTIGGSTGNLSYAYLPSDDSSYYGATCACDTKTKYNNKVNDFIPSLYLEDGTRNPNVDATISGNNVLTDFEGKSNTAQILTFATGQTDWKTASTITNNYNKGYYPAPCCCWRFHTIGTNQGDWYLPAQGELAYVIPRLGLINASIAKVGGTQLGQYLEYISSTENSVNYVCEIFINNGEVLYADKYRDRVVRAFLSVMPNGEIK